MTWAARYCLSLLALAAAQLGAVPALAEPGQAATGEGIAQIQAGEHQIIVSGIRENRSDWKRAEAGHVIIFSDGSEAELKRVTNGVERLHRLMSRLYGQDGQSGEIAKLRIILIDSTRDFRALALRNLRSQEGPYAPAFASQRYYDPRDDGALLVVPRADQTIDLNTAKSRNADCDDMAAVEIVCIGQSIYYPPAARSWESGLYSAYAQHFILSYLPAGYPRWYLDGVGALFSSIKVRRDGSLDYAVIPPVSRQIFRSYGRLDAGDILTGSYLAAPPGRSEWTPYHAAVLAHFFLYSDLKPERQTQFRQYMTAIHQGTPMAEAARLFGDMSRLKREISDYAERDDLAYARTEPATTPDQEPSIVTLSLANAAMLETSVALESLVTDIPGQPDRFTQARKDLDALPYDAEASLLLARAACQGGHYHQCLLAADDVLARSPDDARALGWKGVALTNEAVASQAAARSDTLRTARATIERAIDLDGDAPLPLVAYFQSFAKAGEPVPEPAMLAMAKAIRMVPAAPGLRLSLGAELVRRGRPDLARKLLYPVLFGPYDSPERKQAEDMFAAPGPASASG